MQKKKLVGLAIAAACLLLTTTFIKLPVYRAAANAAAVTTPTPASKTVKSVKVAIAHPRVQFVMKDGKIMVFELYPEYAPATVANFVKLTKEKFYDGLKFHRIVDGFMIQGGDPNGDGSGGSAKTIKGEFSSNGFEKNKLKHTKGVISMARTKEPNSASSQFFIMDGDAAYLDGDYAAFGKLISGVKTLEAISKTPVDYNIYGTEKSVPMKDVIIKKVILLSDGKK